MDKQLLKQVMVDNRHDVEQYHVHHRNVDMDSFPCYVLVGVRRAGKSFLLFQKIQSLLAEGHTWDEIVYLNFEDVRLADFTLADFNSILECHAELGGKRPILFLDEVQNVSGWEKFARNLADTKHSVFITGSNAKMLSREVMTTLGGRYLSVEVFPFSFSECLDFAGVPQDEVSLLSTSGRADVKRLCAEYLKWGGLPEGVGLPVRRSYVSSTYQKIYLGDICARYAISNPSILGLLVKKIAESVMQPISYNRLAKILSSVGGKITTPTVGNYIQYCQDSWLLLRLHNVVASFAERETISKFYFVDNGILSLFLMNCDTILLENAVAVELFRRYGCDPDNERVFFYNSGVEVDFYVPEDELAIQVSYRISASDSTFDREVGALRKLPAVKPCRRRMIITYDEETSVPAEGGDIEVVPFWKWAINR